MELEEEIKKRKKRDFNLAAMKQLIDENGFLKSKYDKLAVNAEERFGYHWNEVICNVLYNKYVKADEKLLERYKALKVRHDNENEKLDVKEVRPDIEIPQENIINKQNMDKTLNEMSAGGGASTGDGGLTGNASGAYETPAAFSANNKSRKFFKNTMVRGSKIVSKGTPDNNMTMKESTASKLCEEFGVLITEFEQNLGAQTSLTSDSQQSSAAKVLTYHIVTNTESDFYADVRDADGNTLFEINSLDEINQLISSGAMKSKEDVEGLGTYLKSQDKMVDGDILELAELNEVKNPENVVKGFAPQSLGLVMEEVKPTGLIQAERIKTVNQTNSLNYYKTLNDGIQDLINAEKEVNVEINATIKYDFDDNGQPVNNGVFPEAEKYNKEYQETAHRGTEDYILDRPDEKYDKRLEKMIGTKYYNIVKEKQKIIKNKDLRNLSAGKMHVVDKSVNESFLSGYYNDFYNNKKIKTTPLSAVKETTVLNEGVKYFETKGVGNAFNEVLKEEIEKFNFYYDLNENTFFKILKDVDSNKQKNMLNESAVNKVKYLTGYDPSKNVKNLVDRSKL